MPQTIVLNSSRSGTGKSTLAVNVALVMAQSGQKIGLLDLDLVRPALALLLGVEPSPVRPTIGDVLSGRSTLDQAILQVWPEADSAGVSGRLFFVPAMSASELSDPAPSAGDFQMLAEAVRRFKSSRQLDILVIDTHSGFSHESLIPLGLADTAVIILANDRQDPQGAAVAIDLARNLGVGRTIAVANLVPGTLNLDSMKLSLQAALGCQVAGVLPYSTSLAAMAGKKPFVAAFPDHPLTTAIKRIAARLSN